MGEAAAVLDRAHQRAPEDPRVTGLFALALSRGYGRPPHGREAAERARTLATRALELEPEQAEALVALAVLHLHNNEADAAIRYLRQGLAVAPNSVEALDWLGRIMAEVGRVDEGITLLRRATAIDPDQLNARFQIARIQAILGNQEAMNNALGELPTHPGDVASWMIIRVRDAMWRRDLETARSIEQLAATVSLSPAARHAVEYLLKVPLGGSEAYANPAFLDEVLPVDASRSPRRASFNAQIRAEFLAAIHHYPEAIEALRSGDGNGLIDIVWLDRCPLFAPLRSDPNFQNLRARVALRATRVVEAIELRGTPPGTSPAGM